MHELEMVDGKANFAYNIGNGKPWHILGTPVEGLQTADEMLQIANADYEVWTEPVFVKDERTGEYVEIDKRYATVRINPATGELQPFEVFTQRYTELQNREVLDKALAIVGASGGDAVVDTLGVLFDGRQFFASIDLGSLVIDPLGAHDEIMRNLLVRTSHDGSCPVTISNTDVRAVCYNTVRMAEKDARAIFKARHTPNYEDRFQEAQAILGLSTAWAESFKRQADEMLRIEVRQNSARFDKVMESLFPKLDADTDRKKANRDEIVTKMSLAFANERNIGKVGENGWALFNAITEVYDWGGKGSMTDKATKSMDEAGLVTRRKLEAQRAVLALAN